MDLLSRNSETLNAWLWALLLAGVVVCIALMTLSAEAKECLPSAAAVRTVHGQLAWSSWTRSMEGHKGEKCYFKAERTVVQNAKPASARHRKLEYGAAPLPVVPPYEPVNAIPLDDELSAVILLAIEATSPRRALVERFAEWRLTYDKRAKFPEAEDHTFSARFASAFPSR